jgi:hypothetical protein
MFTMFSARSYPEPDESRSYVISSPPVFGQSVSFLAFICIANCTFISQNYIDLLQLEFKPLVTPQCHAMKTYSVVEITFHASLISERKLIEWLASRYNRFSPGIRAPVSIG